MSTRKKENGLRKQAISPKPLQEYCTPDSTELFESIKAALLAGRAVRLIDSPPAQRAQVIGFIAQLRDELPILTGWRTIRESHLSETRLRARFYSIPGEFLRDTDHA